MMHYLLSKLVASRVSPKPRIKKARRRRPLQVNLLEKRLLLATGTETSPPTAVADSYSIGHNHTLTIAAPGILANDTDPYGRALTAVLSDRCQPRQPYAQQQWLLHLHAHDRLCRQR
jgi:hypothetical protein